MLGQVVQHGQHTAGVALSYGFHIAAFLQQLAAHVQGQIGRVHHAFDKAQVGGQQSFGVVHDEDAFHIQLDAAFFVAVPQIKWRFAGQVQQLRVLGAAFHFVVAPSQGRLEVVADGFVKLGVLLGADVFFRAGPQGRGFVDGFPFVGHHHFTGLLVLAFFPFFLAHQDGQGDVVGVLADDAFDFPVAQELFGIVTQMQNDVAAALVLGDGFHLEVAAAPAGPAHTFRGSQARSAGFHHDLVGHDEARVKAHTELANQRTLVFGVGLLVAAQLAHEVAGAAFGDRAQVLNRFLLAHANAVVADGQRLGGFVECHANFKCGCVFQQSGVVQGLVAQLVAGIRGVGNQLAQKDFFVGIQGVGDQVQQLGHFGLEGVGVFCHGV